MNILHVIVTHLAPDLVRRQLHLLDLVTPGVPRLIAYGGTRENFDSLEIPDALFLEDESLRKEITSQCFNELLPKTDLHLSRLATTFDFIHVTEYDHLILSPGYFNHLREILAKSQCDFLGEGCNIKTGSNWFPSFAGRENKPLLEFLESISVRENKTELCGCLLNGYTLSRSILKLLAQFARLPRAYSEVLFPSMVYHLGFRIGDVGAYSSMYWHVRHRPAWTKTEALEFIRQGVLCCHPFKDFNGYNEIKNALALASNKPAVAAMSSTSLPFA